MLFSAFANILSQAQDRQTIHRQAARPWGYSPPPGIAKRIENMPFGKYLSLSKLPSAACACNLSVLSGYIG
jgi:hypothetical protein